MNDDNYVMSWQELERIATATADMARELVPADRTLTLQLTVQLSHDGYVTVYSPGTNGYQVPVYDSETDVWESFRQDVSVTCPTAEAKAGKHHYATATRTITLDSEAR
jgi:hypothetical protein